MTRRNRDWKLTDAILVTVILVGIATAMTEFAIGISWVSSVPDFMR